MTMLRRVSEGLARRTSRRGLLDAAFGVLAGAAAGTTLPPDGAGAGGGTVCGFPGPPCPCETCHANGMCGKPCLFYTVFYAGGCWVTLGTTCCDCNCSGTPQSGPYCGCGSDYHNSPTNCPDGNADG
jgi:hypothetical protein